MTCGAIGAAAGQGFSPAAGNQRQASGAPFIFDAETRQTQVTLDMPLGKVFTYAYKQFHNPVWAVAGFPSTG